MSDKSEKDKENEERGESLWRPLALAWEMGYTISIPLVVLALIGRLLDNRLGVSPLFLLLGILISIAVSSVIIVRKVKRFTAE